MIYRQGWRQTSKAVIEGIPAELLHMTEVFPMSAVVRNSSACFANTYLVATESVPGDDTSSVYNHLCNACLLHLETDKPKNPLSVEAVFASKTPRVSGVQCQQS